MHKEARREKLLFAKARRATRRAAVLMAADHFSARDRISQPRKDRELTAAIEWAGRLLRPDTWKTIKRYQATINTIINAARQPN